VSLFLTIQISFNWQEISSSPVEGLFMTITGKLFPCLCLNPELFHLLSCPVSLRRSERAAGRAPGSWPRSALHTREEEAMLTHRQLWKEHLNPGWMKNPCVCEPAQTPYTNTTLQEIYQSLFFPSFQANNPAGGVRRDPDEKLSDFSIKEGQTCSKGSYLLKLLLITSNGKNRHPDCCI